MVGMIILRSVSENERGFESPQYLDQNAARRKIVRQRAIGNVRGEKFGSEQVRAGGHFFAAPRSQVLAVATRLAFIASTQYANGDSRSVASGASESPGAKEVRIVGVGDDGKEPFGFEGKAHEFESVENATSCKRKVGADVRTPPRVSLRLPTPVHRVRPAGF